MPQNTQTHQSAIDLQLPNTPIDPQPLNTPIDPQLNIHLTRISLTSQLTRSPSTLQLTHSPSTPPIDPQPLNTPIDHDDSCAAPHLVVIAHDVPSRLDHEPGGDAVGREEIGWNGIGAWLGTLGSELPHLRPDRYCGKGGRIKRKILYSAKCIPRYIYFVYDTHKKKNNTKSKKKQKKQAYISGNKQKKQKSLTSYM